MELGVGKEEKNNTVLETYYCCIGNIDSETHGTVTNKNMPKYDIIYMYSGLKYLLFWFQTSGHL